MFATTPTRAGDTSFAMFLSGYSVLEGNRINHDPNEVGTCQGAISYWCGGIEAIGATTTITNNVIFGMPSQRSVALHMGDGEVPLGLITVNGNVLDGGGAPHGGSITTVRSTALSCSHNGQGVAAKVGRINNNIILGGLGANRFGFFEETNTNGKSCEPITYYNNDIFFPTLTGSTDNAHRRWTNAGHEVLLPTVAEVNLELYGQDNFTADPMLDATFHLQAGSQCIDAGTDVDAPATDMDGEPRPQGAEVDVGADEAG